MGYSASEKMLQRVSGNKEAAEGDYVEAELDYFVNHGIETEAVFGYIGATKIWNPDKFALFQSHHQFLPVNDFMAEEKKTQRRDAKKIGVKNIFGAGSGMCHYIMPEQGLAFPGAVIAGSDSHTTTYGGIGSYSIAITAETPVLLATGKTWFIVPETVKLTVNGKIPKGSTIRDVCQYAIGEFGQDAAIGFTTLEYAGPVVEKCTLQERWVLGAWAYEMGAGSSYIAPNEDIVNYYRKRTKVPFTPVYNDPDVHYSKEYELNVSDMGPKVAVPYHPGNTKDVEEVVGTPIQQAYVGGCTGGNIESLRQTAELLKGHKVHPDVRMFVAPGTREIELTAIREGLYEIFSQSGCMTTPAYCGPCQMLCVGNLATDETMIGTHPRNYSGRTAKGTKVYLGSPYTVAASAIEGQIADPRKYLGVA